MGHWHLRLGHLHLGNFDPHQVRALSSALGLPVFLALLRCVPSSDFNDLVRAFLPEDQEACIPRHPWHQRC